MLNIFIFFFWSHAFCGCYFYIFIFLTFIGQYSPAICLIIASYTGCNRTLTVFLLTLGVGLNGSIYSGFKINHLGNSNLEQSFRMKSLKRVSGINYLLNCYLFFRHHATICWHFDGIHKLYREFSWFISSNSCRQPDQ